MDHRRTDLVPLRDYARSQDVKTITAYKWVQHGRLPVVRRPPRVRHHSLFLDSAGRARFAELKAALRSRGRSRR